MKTATILAALARLPNTVEQPLITRNQITRKLVLIQVAFCLASTCFAIDEAKPGAPLCGRQSELQGLPVLELWGSPRQAGYAHGFLLADEIVRLIDEFMLDEKIINNSAMYEAMLIPTVRRQFVWTDDQLAELNAILEGVRDRLGDQARSKILDRELVVEDLMAGNTLADWFGMFCSTFSVWGALTADGQTITARNLDFPSTTALEQLQVVVIRHGSGKARSWAGVSWPGMIGAYTAMNAGGVTIAMHDARGLKPTEVLGFTPRSLILREALESASPESFVDDVAAVFRKRRVAVGNNIHVSGPRCDGRPPAAVFEYDANADTSDGVTTRTAESSDAPISDGLWCTNHHRLRQPPQDRWRYKTLTERLTKASGEGAQIDPKGAIRLIREVKQDMTLHTVCFVPDRKLMYVLIPSISDNLVEFELTDWLNRPTASDLSSDNRPTGG